MRTLIIAALLCASGAAGAQVFKCPDAAGKLVLQQTPCPGGQKLKVSPAAGHDPEPAAAPAAAAPKTSYTDQLVQEREARERWIKMNDTALRLDREQAACEDEQNRILAAKRLSNNNLAGATRDVSLSNEMQAAATRCASRLATTQQELGQRRAECERLGCRRPGT